MSSIRLSTAVNMDPAPSPTNAQPSNLQVHHRFEQVGDVKLFYREAGNRNAPTVLLLHGYATSSFMYRNLIPQLADRYHVIAPDLPGFGFTEAPPRGKYEYTFDQLAETLTKFTDQLSLERYAMQVFDYGAPVGWRMALANPSRVSAIISQNGNAYEEGLGEGWVPIQRYWNEPTKANREALKDFPTPASIKWQYLEGVRDSSLVAPDAIALESWLVSRPGNAEVQLDLLLDYANNVAKYPEFQSYFRMHQPPLLAVWGERDPFFLPAGANAWKRDIPNADVRFYDTGHLALETHGNQIAPVIRAFLDSHVK